MHSLIKYTFSCFQNSVFQIRRLRNQGRSSARSQGPILQDTILAENLTDKFSPTNFGHILTQKQKITIYANIV
jgi:hypothetical protein